MNLIPIGFGSYVVASRIRSITPADHKDSCEKPIRDAVLLRRCIYATNGRRRRSAIRLDSGHLVVSAVPAGVLNQRMNECIPSTGK
ncbi:MAG: DUF370 domain-containing protein [Desulfobacteraceae bacterium]|nr:DUF370 domain-containing protein [Desulfobacteraceae bacterium]